MASDSNPVVIVGGGITGLSLAERCADAGIPSVVIEKEDRPGGLARSFTYDDFTFDIGPHRFHTDVSEVEDYIRDVLAQDLRTIPRESWVRFKGEFYPWPLHPSFVMLKFPPSIAAGALLDIVSLMKPDVVSFKDQIVNMYGETLYRHFFEGYSAKFLGIVPELTHPDWASTGIDRAIIDNRLKMKNLRQLLFSIMLPIRAPETEFIYPAGGCEQFIVNLARKYEAQGGELLCGRAVDSMETDGDTITQITVGDRSFTPSQVVWTGTVHSLAAGLGLDRPDLHYRALVCYNLRLSEGKNLPFQWCYHGAADIIFSRVSIPANFDRDNTPGGKRSMCVEVTCDEGDKLYQDPMQQLDRLIYDLKREGLLRADQEVLDVHTENFPWSYPIYKFDYKQKLGRFREQLGGFDNLLTAGRLGNFWYNNMDHCIAASQAMVKKIAQRVAPR